MRLLLYGDLQASEGHERLFSNPTVPLQRHRVAMFYKQLAEIYDEHDCHGIIDLGDSTDDRTAIPIGTIHTIDEGISRLPSSDYNIKILGNHDQFIKSGTIHAGGLFKSKFHIIPDRETRIIGGVKFVFCSYPEDEANLSEWMQTELAAPFDRSNGHDGRHVVIGHFDVDGTKVHGETLSSKITVGSLRSSNLTLLGHIHVPSSVSKTIHYVGSPFQQDFGEANESKRVAVLDTDTLKVVWVPTIGFPIYRKVTLKEFVASVQEGSENRYQVVLKTAKETEIFYAHPLSNRAEPVYNYVDSKQRSESSAQQDAPMSSSDMKETLGNYVKLVPPSSFGVDLSADDIVAVGLQLVE